MKLAAFDAFCAKLPGTSFVVQWGESHVHKVGGKLFALGNAFGGNYVVFKTTPLAFEVLREQGLAERAPYLPRGHWVKVNEDAMKAKELQGYLRQSYELVAGKLPKVMRKELGI